MIFGRSYLCLYALTVTVVLLQAPRAFGECSDKLLAPNITQYSRDVRLQAYTATMLTEDEFNKADTSIEGNYKMFGFSYADAQDSRRRYEKFTQSTLTYDEAVTYFQMIGNDVGYEKYVQCKKLERGNTYFAARVEGQPDGLEFTVRLEWYPAPGDKGGLSNTKACLFL